MEKLDRWISRIGYLVLGLITGIFSGVKFTSEIESNKIIHILVLVIICSILSLITEAMLDEKLKKIIGAIILFLLMFPIAWFVQYIYALILWFF